ncbi:hypothetical protein [Roseivirga sp. E12]|uniref:hypothetical protein n=1 Tax=Roseivirga sp. E12 TaxID=2819237 RepID=UPI001ABC9862|nr:hypothetical protein [Roseivirga sp. E12]MBO3700367.1 hypothetical protein [Roseivirga sp. E12]
MKKTMLLLFALTVLTFGCADASEDTMPDPVVPEVQLDDQKSEGTEKKGRSMLRKKG